MSVAARFVGQRVTRREDARFLTGHGEYVADITLPGTVHLAFVRSDVAKGRIVSVDVAAAQDMPGVVAVYTASDLNHLVRNFAVDDEPHGRGRPFRLLADGDVRFVGEPIAVVVASSRYRAEDAAEAVVVLIEAATPVLDARHALDAGVAVVHPDKDSNLYSQIPARPDPEFDRIVAAAPIVVTETFRQHRHATVPLETRGIVSNWEARRGQLTVWISTQGPHGARSVFARLLGLDDSQVRVVMPDVGGSFGLKMHARCEEFATVIVSHVLGRPAKWIQDRRENLVADEHARADEATLTVAVDEEGTVLALGVDFLESAGSFIGAGGSAIAFTTMLYPGPYRVGACRGSATSVFTNTAGRGAYRGPWMVETVVREQMMDCVAARVGLDPLEFRRRNVIRQSELPYTMGTGLTYDQMTADATLEQAAVAIGYDEWRQRQQAMRAEGRLVGIGISLFAEPSAMSFGWMSTDAAIVRVGANGRVDVSHTGGNHGQSLETTVAQVVADELGVDIDHVRVVGGDTDSTPVGPGTGGSRSAVILATAARQAASEVRARVMAIAAQQLEAAVEDLTIEDGRVFVQGSPARAVTLAEVAHVSYAMPGMVPAGVPLGLEAQARYAPANFITWANACHICVCEIDQATGGVEILRYVVSEDCGPMINPNVVEGQIAGGVVQGIGGVLLEHLPYDETGTPLAGTFVDYLLPTTTEVPIIEYAHVETHAPTNPGGYKGLGEGGAIGAPPAVFNAVADALAPLGVVVRDQPLGPADIVALMEAAGHHGGVETR